MKELQVKLGNVTFQNPIIPASGTFGFGYEFMQFYDINLLGGIALKGTTLEPRYGNPLPRIAECAGGMLNAVGLQNPGVHKVIGEELIKLQVVYQQRILANISGFSLEEYVEVSKQFDACDAVDILEINVSCPNVAHGGLSFGTDPVLAADIVCAVKAVCRKPVYVKLSPNVTSIAELAAAVEAAGADGISMINTLMGMRFDLATGKPILANKTGGVSGPCIRPVAQRMIYQVYEAVKIPIIGMGGIACAEDVLEMMYAGASAVQVGAANLVDPYACQRIIADLPRVMKQYCINALQDIIGKGHQ